MPEIKVLILEDNHTDAMLLQREMKNSEFHFTTKVVQTRAEFENALQEEVPDIILSDYSLPSFDGVTAFHIARKKSEIPFIIVSGTIGEENAVELIRNGVTDYVLKDKLFTLIYKINRALRERAEIREKAATNERIRIQNEKLFEIAFLQSHQVRVPVAHILGLFDLFNFKDPANPINGQVLCELKLAAESLDSIIHDIVLKTGEITKTVNAA